MRALLGGAAGLLGTRVPVPGGPSWQRTSFSGSAVSLSGGVSAASGILIAALCAKSSVREAALIAGVSGAIAGYIDDHRESTTAKGLKGHIGMLKQGRITTGALKIGIIGGGSALAALILTAADQNSSRAGQAWDWATRSTAIAGTANLINLLDLRPGRALKASGLIAALLAPGSKEARPLLAGTAGTIAGTIGDDLAGRTMLGDLGANALGAVLGAALAAHPSCAVRTAGAAGAAGLILSSEKISFSAVIEASPVLSAIDGWGR